MEPEAGGDSPFLRLHPASLLFAIAESARRFLVPGLLVLLLSRGEAYEVGLMVLFVPGIVTALARWMSFGYRLGADGLVIRDGILQRNERHVPYARIQNVDLVRNPLHRLLGVADVRIETASGTEAEATIRVLSLDAVDRLRARIFPEGRSPREAAPTDALLRLRVGDVAIVGLASNRGLALVAAALGALWQFDRVGDEDRLQRLFESLNEAPLLRDAGPVVTALLVVAGLSAVLLAFKLLSILWAMMRFHGFTLHAHGDDLRAEYGLLTRVTATIPRHRIQRLAVSSSPLHRVFGRSTVLVETAGARAEEGESATDRLWLAPVIDERRVAAFVREIVPAADLERFGWRPLAPRAAARMARRGALRAVVLAAVAWPWLGAWAFALFAAGAVVGTVHARAWVARAGWAITDEVVARRAGWWRREISVVRFAKIQAVALDSTPFDRRAAMASLGVDTAGRGRIGRMRLRYLAAADAAMLADRLAVEAGSRAFHW